MKTLALAVALILSGPACADGFSVAGGADVAHDPGEMYGEIRYSHDLYEFDSGINFGASAYLGSMSTKGIGIYAKGESLLFGFGVEYADANHDTVNSEHGYELRAEWEFVDQWSIGIKHRSNCATICRKVPFLDNMKKGSADKNNHGFNYLIVRYEF